jgi:hypothetical protein
LGFLASPEGGEMTGKFIMLLSVALPLVGCIGKEKRRAEFMERCAAAKFEHEQCVFLLANRREGQL